MSVAKNIDVNSRTQYLKSLNNFILQSKSTVTKLLGSLGWKEESTIRKNESFVTCPYNDAHRMPSSKRNDHVKQCSWKQQGYCSDDEPFPDPPEKFVPGTVVLDQESQKVIIRNFATQDPNIKIGDDINNRPVPQTTNRLFSDYTTDERRILYDYVVAKTKDEHPQLKEFALPVRSGEQKGPKTLLEILAAERDSKRRRVRYKAKVHTKNKTYVEIMRQVIKNQMEAYEDWLQQECGIIQDDSETLTANQETHEKETEKKQEKIWLEWNFQGNPHTRWKDVLEKEKRHQQRLKERSDKSSEEDRNVRDEDGRRRDYDKHRSRRYDRINEEREYKKYDNKRYDYDVNNSKYERSDDRKERHKYRERSEHKSRHKYYEYDRKDKEYRRYYEDTKYRKRHRSRSRESSVRSESESSKAESKTYEEGKTKRHKHKKKHKKRHSSKKKHRSSSSSSEHSRNSD